MVGGSEKMTRVPTSPRSHAQRALYRIHGQSILTYYSCAKPPHIACVFNAVTVNYRDQSAPLHTRDKLQGARWTWGEMLSVYFVYVQCAAAYSISCDNSISKRYAIESEDREKIELAVELRLEEVFIDQKSYILV